MVKPNWEGFSKAVMEHWPGYDLDGGDLQDLAEKFGLITPVEGGFDPDKHHDDDHYGAEPGDPWYTINYKG